LFWKNLLSTVVLLAKTGNKAI
jgi:hypothetical protein